MYPEHLEITAIEIVTVNQPCDPKHGTCPAGECERGYKDSTCSTDM